MIKVEIPSLLSFLCPAFNLWQYSDDLLYGYGDYQPKRDNYKTMYFVDHDVTAYKTCNATSMGDFFSLLLEVFLCFVNSQTWSKY